MFHDNEALFFQMITLPVKKLINVDLSLKFNILLRLNWAIVIYVIFI